MTLSSVEWKPVAYTYGYASAPVFVEVTATGQRVRVVGPLDVRTVPDLRLALHDIVDGGTGEVLLYLAEAEIGDATGLGVIVEAYTRARRAGRVLAVADMTERTERLLRLSRLHRSLVRPVVRGSLGPSRTVSTLTA